MPDTLAACYAQPQPPAGEAVEPELGAAFVGLGLVMEFVAHRAMEVTCGQCEIPIELTAVEVGPRERGREIVSIDLSEYGGNFGGQRIFAFASLPSQYAC